MTTTAAPDDNRLRKQMQQSMERVTGQFFCTTCRLPKPADQKVLALKRSLCKSCLARRKAVDAKLITARQNSAKPVVEPQPASCTHQRGGA